MWTCKFRQDTGETGVGTMRAEYVVGGVVIAAYEQRMVNGEDGQARAFITAARAALALAQAKKTIDDQQQALAVALATRLNGG